MPTEVSPLQRRMSRPRLPFQSLHGTQEARSWIWAGGDLAWDPVPAESLARLSSLYHLLLTALDHEFSPVGNNFTAHGEIGNDCDTEIQRPHHPT